MAKNWEKKCDKLIKQLCLSKGHCERCKATDKQLHHHHLISRVVKTYRHCPENVMCLCASCHTMAPWSAHNDATGFREWLKTTDRWEWYENHTVKSVEVIANQEIEKYKSKKIPHLGDETEYTMLKLILGEML